MLFSAARLTRIPLVVAALAVSHLTLHNGPAGAALPTGFADQLVVGGLSQPSGIAFLPDGRILVAEQKTARLRVVANGAVSAGTVISEVNTSGNERGLLGVAVDPAWPTRPYVYLHHNRTGLINYIVRYKASGDLTNPSSTNLTFSRRLVLIDDIPDNAFNHNGGTVRFGPDGSLFVSCGEDADPCGAQSIISFKGMILRLKVDALSDTFGFTIPKADITPADNPYVGNVNARARLVWAHGLRNPFRFHVDPRDGTLFLADVGQNTWEEVNECRGGENFGWPQFEGNAPYSGFNGSCPASSPVAPIATYNRTLFGGAASVISATLYYPMPGGQYNFPIDYHGDYFFAEYYQGFIRRIKKTGGSWAPAPAVPGQPTVDNWATATTNVSDYAVGPDGGLYYCKQFGNPEIRRIVYTNNPSGVGDGSSGDWLPNLTAQPNPLRAGGTGVRLQFQMAVAGPVRLSIYDVGGRLVRTLRDGHLDAGPGEAHWDGVAGDGRPVRSGVYFVRLDGPGTALTTRVVVSGR